MVNIESTIFKNDYIAFTKKDGLQGINISTFNLDIFLECTPECATELANDLLKSVKEYNLKK